MKNENKYMTIKTFIENMDDEDLIAIHNEYESVVRGENTIYPMDEFDDMCSGMSPSEVARSVFYGSRFNPNDDWFCFNGYGNLESIDYPRIDENVFPCDIARHICENEDSLGFDEIQSLLDDEADD